jgi:hypothetical protein
VARFVPSTTSHPSEESNRGEESMTKFFAVCVIATLVGSMIQTKRLFVAAVANDTLEVVDLTGGKVIKSLAGFKDTQDALFLGGGDFNKLYVSSLDGHARVFQGESF